MSAEVAAAAGTSLLSSAANIYMQNKQNKENQAMAREQMAFQERMSNTAHQRESADLIAAGLNRRLSAGASGASTPTGASTTGVAPRMEDPSENMNPARKTKLSGEQFEQQKIMDAQSLQQGVENIKLTRLQQETEANKAANMQEDTFNKVQNNKMLELNYGDKSSARNAQLRQNLYNERAEAERIALAKAKEQDTYSAKAARFDNENSHFLIRSNSAASQTGKWLDNINSAVSIFKPFGKMNNNTPHGYTDENYNSQGEHTGSRSRRYHYEKEY